MNRFGANRLRGGKAQRLAEASQGRNGRDVE
jgi:hypothetical protein